MLVFVRSRPSRHKEKSQKKVRLNNQLYIFTEIGLLVDKN